ncbi:MAG: endonuclease Q family protein [Candidatus Nanoarchaeia archaeon]|nr:endonuclease Q family protein [Candidatus Haiyanarchaeum thermophilum]MCW1302926.1 endonuclease Q family protein [Candidatus Haiyanarchaeum thermophilum]MCW1303603.1 endonuclease Q family protein [Candidatus Haiyanarchaeum thermophilum]MCW1306285.1 endonuclease Q family protein [Candidatus Haiyanarchaeum thermophilum]MCW1307205.1 endonuclease Q family protein [Candidatus Haiyanarchaeum thermophilum]
MRVISDFHIHSFWSRATSKEMNLDGIAAGARVKGLNLVGTGDFTHPKWLSELKEKLEPIPENGVFRYQGVFFTLTTEVATYFTFLGRWRRIHHVIHAPSFEIVAQINESLSKYGDLSADGRPILRMSAPELVETLMEISPDILIYPAHAWTPWMSCFGSRSGFDSLEECYQDQVKHISALETGLSSDPPMNWRLSSLDRFTLLSNSDSHSPHPWRLGREANVFELKEIDYWEILEVIRRKDRERFLYTIEVDPNYGKYHFDGHRNCKISLHPIDAIKLGNICPKCGKKLTVGVLHRVEELADREEGFIPENAIPFKTLLPLYEIISSVLGIGELYSQRVLEEHNKLINKFQNELDVLLMVPKEKLLEVTSKEIADAIIKVRERKVKYIPGYDGVYGRPIFDESFEVSKINFYPFQRRLDQF